MDSERRGAGLRRGTQGCSETLRFAEECGEAGSAVMQTYPCSMAKTFLIAGATGLVGSEVMQQALAVPNVERVVVLVRRGTGLSHPKLVEWISGDDDLLSGLKGEHVDAVICCLGTTIRAVGGDQRKFIHVDKDLVFGLGQWAKAHGVGSFAVVSAMGADAASRIFYSRVKGEMEAGLRSIGLPRLAIFQPSILTGGRKEFRLGERIGIGVMSVLAPLMRGKLSDYRPMHSVVLAKAMISASLDEERTGVRVLRYREIVALARS